MRKTPYGKLDSDYGISGSFYYVRAKVEIDGEFVDVRLGSFTGQPNRVMVQVRVATTKTFSNTGDAMVMLDLKGTMDINTIECEIAKIQYPYDTIVKGLFSLGWDEIMSYCNRPKLKCNICGSSRGIMTSTSSGICLCENHRGYLDTFRKPRFTPHVVFLWNSDEFSPEETLELIDRMSRSEGMVNRVINGSNMLTTNVDNGITKMLYMVGNADNLQFKEYWSYNNKNGKRMNVSNSYKTNSDSIIIIYKITR
jgi:hypothetical protein